MQVAASASCEQSWTTFQSQIEGEPDWLARHETMA